MILYEYTSGTKKVTQGAAFADDYTKAQRIKQDAECGLGAYAEIYGRQEYSGQPDEYVLIES